MKDYEKGAIAIGVAALGFAAYQAIKTKEAVDATHATDPSRNPVTTAVELARNTIGSTGSWFRQRFDNATGYTKGKSQDVVDWVTGGFNEAGNFVYGIGSTGLDFGKNATEAGTKYVWSFGANAAKTGKDTVKVIGNKSFTLMGSVPTYIYNAARNVPKRSTDIANAISGVGSKLETTTKSTSTNIFNRVKSFFGR